MRKLILGCGYLGRRVARVWLEAGHAVSVLTRSPQHARELAADGLQAVIGDVTDPASLTSLPDAETVLYAVGFDRLGGHLKRDVYVNGLENVLTAVVQRVDRCLYVSSTSVYGQNAGEWVDESSVCVPTDTNGQICLEAEQLVWQFFPPGNAPSERGACVLRFAGIYGPGRLLRRLESLQTGEPLTGNPDAWLNLIHVDDAVASIVASERSPICGTTVLVSDGHPVRRRDYFEGLAVLAGAPPPTFSKLDSVHQHALNKRCSNRKLREELRCELKYLTYNTGLPHAIGGIDSHNAPNA